MVITNKAVREMRTEFDNKHAFSLHLHIFVVNRNRSMSSGFLVTTVYRNQL
jgi:predicted DNA-binding protein with PD1-like motif